MSAIGPEQDLLDTREMLVVHSLFRRELRLAGEVVRLVPDRERLRARLVSRHLQLVERVLHDHHAAEDRLLWPLLTARVADDLAPLVELMEAQHQEVDGLLEQITEQRPAWAEDPTTSRGQQLATLYDRLYAGLVEHLDAEETRVLPLVARTITKPEWAALGEAGRKGIPRRHMPLVFGMLIQDSDPEIVATMLAPAPLPVRALVPRLGRRAYRKHALRIHGTAAP